MKTILKFWALKTQHESPKIPHTSLSLCFIPQSLNGCIGAYPLLSSFFPPTVSEATDGIFPSPFHPFGAFSKKYSSVLVWQFSLSLRFILRSQCTATCYYTSAGHIGPVVIGRGKAHGTGSGAQSPSNLVDPFNSSQGTSVSLVFSLPLIAPES
jgi:hypothetical protein